jgi:hypothetical protein
MEEKNGLVIGPSLGYMFMHGVYDLRKHGEFLREAGTNAAELVMYFKEEQRQNAMLEEKIYADFVSIHLEDFSPEISLIRQVFMAKQIFDFQQARVGVLHTVGVKEFYLEALTEIGITVAIENMDKAKSSGHKKWELEYLLKKFNLKFVLDIQHAYEHDDSMQYAWDIFQMARDNISHLHVSGQSKGSPHTLVHRADNRDAIIRFLGSVLYSKKVPIILEGLYRFPSEIKQEIEFIKRELESR